MLYLQEQGFLACRINLYALFLEDNHSQFATAKIPLFEFFLNFCFSLFKSQQLMILLGGTFCEYVICLSLVRNGLQFRSYFLSS